jgi:hypothetical protein
MQQYADIYLLLNYSACFGRPSRPSSGVHKTVVAASGTDHTIWEASFFKRDQRSLIRIAHELAWYPLRVSVAKNVVQVMTILCLRIGLTPQSQKCPNAKRKHENKY